MSEGQLVDCLFCGRRHTRGLLPKSLKLLVGKAFTYVREDECWHYRKVTGVRKSQWLNTFAFCVMPSGEIYIYPKEHRTVESVLDGCPISSREFDAAWSRAQERIRKVKL